MHKWVLIYSLLFIVFTFWRHGYQYLVADHQVLSPMGMHLANAEYFLNDHFVEKATQPHWLFTYITFLGELTGTTWVVYFIYWFVSMCTFGLALALISENRSEGTKQALFFVPYLMIMGPLDIFGTANPLLGWALPHVLGTALFVVSLIYLEKRHIWGAGISGFLCMAVHVQYGIFLLPGLVLYLVFEWKNLKPQALRGSLLLLFILGIFGVIIMKMTSLGGANSNFPYLCEKYIPYHCFPQLWPWRKILVGLVLIISCIGYSMFLKTPYVAFYAIGLGVGFVSNYLRVPFFGELFQRANIYRLSAPMSFFGITCSILLIRSGSFRQKIMGSFILPSWYMFSIIGYILSSLSMGWSLYPIMAAFFLILISWASDVNSFSEWKNLKKFLFIVIVGCWSLSLITDLDIKALLSEKGTLEETSISHVGQQIFKATTSGSTILSPPQFNWLRLASRRAVYVDNKFIPYGGEEFKEFERRQRLIYDYQNLSQEDFGRLLDKEQIIDYVIFEDANEKAWLRWNNLDLVGTYFPESQKIFLFKVNRNKK